MKKIYIILVLVVLSVMLLTTKTSNAKKGAYFGLGYRYSALNYGVNELDERKAEELSAILKSYAGSSLNGLMVFAGYNFEPIPAFSYGIELKYNLGVDFRKELIGYEKGLYLQNEAEILVNLLYNLSPKTSFLMQIGGGWMNQDYDLENITPSPGAPQYFHKSANSGFMTTNIGIENTLYKGLKSRIMFETKYLTNRDLMFEIANPGSTLKLRNYELGASVSLLYNF